MTHPVILKRGEEEERGERDVGGCTCEEIETGIRVECMKDVVDDNAWTPEKCKVLYVKRALSGYVDKCKAHAEMFKKGAVDDKNGNTQLRLLEYGKP